MRQPKRLIVGTRNEAKRALYGRLFMEMGVEVLSLAEIGLQARAEEPGDTAEENARQKALFYASQGGSEAFSEDEALYVDFLPSVQQPGVHVRRITGTDEAGDDALLAYWADIVGRVPEADRTGRWHIAYCIASSQGKSTTIAHDYKVRFFSPPSSVVVPGWPMSSLQGPVAFGKPRSELNDSERDQWEAGTARYIEELWREFASES